MTKIALIGFGEAATAVVTDWPADILKNATGFDLKSSDPANQMTDRFAKAGVTECTTAQDAVSGADAVFSFVTADQAQAAAESAAPLKAGALFFDCNSISPGGKRHNAQIVEDQGGRYVDTAVLAPVHPALTRVPTLLSGPHAQDGKALMDQLGMNATIAEGPVGYASTIKMIRSIAVKGIECVLAECALSAVREGVDDVVFDSLDQMFPGFDFRKRAGYHLERIINHGPRRGAEMEEVAKTVTELGLPDHMSVGSAKWETAIGDLSLSTTSEDLADVSSLLLPHFPRP